MIITLDKDGNTIGNWRYDDMADMVEAREQALDDLEVVEFEIWNIYEAGKRK